VADSWTDYQERATRTVRRARELIAQSDALREASARLGRDCHQAMDRAHAAIEQACALIVRQHPAPGARIATGERDTSSRTQKNQT
jgi:hypothetical protein